MHHVIAFLQLGEIDVKRRLHRVCMPALETAWALDLVARENLCVGHHDEICLVKKKTTPYRSNLCPKSILRFPKVVFAPYLQETLTFTVVIAQDTHRVTLARPAMQLRKKLTSLRLSQLMIGQPSS